MTMMNVSILHPGVSVCPYVSSSAAASFEPLLRALDEGNVARALCAVACQRRYVSFELFRMCN